MEFGHEFQTLYGKNHMTMNVHLLIHHVPQNCRQFRPLWGIWCYPFEKMLGYIKNFIHGTKNPETSFVFGCKIVNLAPILEDREFSRIFEAMCPQRYKFH